MKRRCVGLAVVVALTALLGVAAGARDDDEQVVRWDIVDLVPGPAINAGGVASAKATNVNQTAETSTITMTGTGTFEVSEEDEEGDDVTGGGTWEITTGGATTSGKYKVTGVVRWTEAPGALPLALGDGIGNPADRRAGLAVLRIKYSDGDLGTLVLSCTFSGPTSGTTPLTVFEGITATKGFTGYWKAQAPTGGPGPGNANRTLFHVTSEED